MRDTGLGAMGRWETRKGVLCFARCSECGLVFAGKDLQDGICDVCWIREEEDQAHAELEQNQEWQRWEDDDE